MIDRLFDFFEGLVGEADEQMHMMRQSPWRQRP